jgi:DoxX-like family
MTTTTSNGKALNIALWAAQLLLAAAFGLFGAMKATQPVDQLATMMKWVPTMSPLFVRTLGTFEVLGAIGLVLPWLTGIRPKLTIAAAICFVVLQLLAVALHVTRGEFDALGLNAVLIALAAFVLWGRRQSA